MKISFAKSCLITGLLTTAFIPLLSVDINKGMNQANAQTSCLNCYLIGIWNIQINLNDGSQINHQIRITKLDQDFIGTYNDVEGSQFDIKNYSKKDGSGFVVLILPRPPVDTKKQYDHSVILSTATTDTLINGRYFDVGDKEGTVTLTKQ